MKTKVLLVLIALILTIGCRKKEATTATDTTGTPVATITEIDTTPTGATVAVTTIELVPVDKQFVLDAGTALINEIEYAKTADNQAVDVAVKALAHLVRLDLETLNADIKRLAEKHGVVLPASAGASTVSHNEALGKTSGRKFDQEFLRHIIVDHTAMIVLFDAESKVVSDDELKEWVNKTIPMLQAHLAKAKELQEKIGKQKY